MDERCAFSQRLAFVRVLEGRGRGRSENEKRQSIELDLSFRSKKERRRQVEMARREGAFLAWVCSSSPIKGVHDPRCDHSRTHGLRIYPGSVAGVGGFRLGRLGLSSSKTLVPRAIVNGSKYIRALASALVIFGRTLRPISPIPRETYVVWGIQNI